MPTTESARAHEEGLALFIEPNWRARFRGALDNEKLRAMGTLVSCVPGRLAYFHDEEYDNRHILRRPA